MAKIVVSGMYMICGLYSSYLFHSGMDLMGIFMPGLLFNSLTLVICLAGREHIPLKSFFFFYVFSNAVYLIVFYATLYSGFAGIYSGIFLTGLGAYSVFALTRKYLRKISFSPGWVFITGALCFAACVSLMFEPLAAWIYPVYDIHPEHGNTEYYGINITFAPSFLFWQTVVGTKLAWTILENRPDAVRANNRQPSD